MKRSEMQDNQKVRVIPIGGPLDGKTGIIRRIQIARDGGAYVQMDEPLPDLNGTDYEASFENSILFYPVELEAVE